MNFCHEANEPAMTSEASLFLLLLHSLFIKLSTHFTRYGPVFTPHAKSQLPKFENDRAHDFGIPHCTQLVVVLTNVFRAHSMVADIPPSSLASFEVSMRGNKELSNRDENHKRCIRDVYGSLKR